MSESPENLYFVLPQASMPDTASPATMGSKAYGLLQLARLGLPVPPAFVLGTAVCREYFARGGVLPEETQQTLRSGLGRLEEATGCKFGGARRPLLVAVRSGAPVSMPGMMDTLLNIGLCEQTLRGLLRTTGNPRLAYDCYRRLVRDFIEVVHGATAAPFDALLEQTCIREGVANARELDSASLAQLATESLEAMNALIGEPFPQAPLDQLVQAVEAVFRSWNSEKAQQYRRINRIDDTIGTAVTVQAMVFGNSGSTSGAGVGFTRDPATGEDRLYLDFLFNAQGEDVVSGRHTVSDTARLAARLPAVSAELQRVRQVLESAFHDMQDFEFTVESGRLHLLQTRNGKRTPWAALRIALEMVRAGQITPAQALERLQSVPLDRIERSHLNTGIDASPLANAVSAGIGVAAGSIAFSSRRAVELAAQGLRVILAREDIETSDIEGIAAADGVLTATGGRTSHAAVVARQLGKVCLVGCTALRVDAERGTCIIGNTRLSEGEELTLDGDSGKVYAGRLSIVRERPEQELAEVAAWRLAAG